MRRSIAILAPFGILAGAAGGIFALNALRPEPEKNEEAARPPAVFVVEAAPSATQLTVKTQGEVRPRTEIDLVPEVSGKIVFVSPRFEAGGIFEVGETLIEIEAADYELAVIRAEARVAEAVQILERERAESDLARREFAELGRGEPNALALREPQLAGARASLAAAEADLADARLQLSRTAVKAPFSGRVRQRQVGLGQFVQPGAPLGRIFSTEVVEVRLPLTDRELGVLDLPVAFAAEDAEGPRVVFAASIAGKPRTWIGRVTRTDSAIDPQTRVVFAIAELRDPYGAGADQGAPMAVGLFVGADVHGPIYDGAYELPRAALRGTDELFVIRPDKTLEIRQVDIVQSTPETVVLRQGLEPGDLVAVSPVRAPIDGMTVEPILREEARESAIATAAIGGRS